MQYLTLLNLSRDAIQNLARVPAHSLRDHLPGETGMQGSQREKLALVSIRNFVGFSLGIQKKIKGFSLGFSLGKFYVVSKESTLIP